MCRQVIEYWEATWNKLQAIGSYYMLKPTRWEYNHHNIELSKKRLQKCLLLSGYNQQQVKLGVFRTSPDPLRVWYVPPSLSNIVSDIAGNRSWRCFGFLGSWVVSSLMLGSPTVVSWRWCCDAPLLLLGCCGPPHGARSRFMAASSITLSY